MNRAAAVIAIVVAGTMTSFAQQPASPVALVNGEPISRADFDAAMKQRVPVFKRLSPEQQKQLQADVITALSDDLLLKQFLRANSQPIKPVEIDRQWADLEKSLAAQKRSIADYCRETNQSPEQLRAAIAEMLQWTAYAAGRITEVDLKKYYTEYKPFFDNASVRVSHIMIRIPANAPAGERTAAEAQLSQIRDEITTGKLTFAQAATKYSQCPSAQRGGDLGYIARRWMVDEAFASAAFKLDKGVVSGVVNSDIGCHLILVTDKRPGAGSVYEDPRIKTAVRECVMEEMRQRLVADLRAKAKIEVKLQ